MKHSLPLGLLAGLFVLYGCAKDSPEIALQTLEMIEVPAGSFLMGSDKGYVLNETPRRTVNLSGFLLSQYEVTEHQYLSTMNKPLQFTNCGNCPVEWVNWYDAIEFCNELSAKEGFMPAYILTADTVIWDRTADGYRLPTEAEWEYACKAGTDTDFHTGDMLAFAFLSQDSALHNAGWYSVNSDNRAHAVGQKQANAFGLFDMHGNVWEWCWDYFNEERYLFMEDPSDNPADDNPSAERILRGGSFFNDAFNARSSLRYYGKPEEASRAVGFRVARN